MGSWARRSCTDEAYGRGRVDDKVEDTPSSTRPATMIVTALDATTDTSCVSLHGLRRAIPVTSCVVMIKGILDLSWNALGVRANLRKSLVSPIHCVLHCEVKEFQSAYLGLPFLSIHQMNKADLQPLIDKITDQLPGWKGSLITRAAGWFWSRLC
jgi:hypothetical protein